MSQIFECCAVIAGKCLLKDAVIGLRRGEIDYSAASSKKAKKYY